ncbi:MAG: serine hydrolase [Desulfobacterales bacterium]
METVDRIMQQGVSESVFPGSVLLVSRGGRTVFLKAYGKADIFENRKMTVNTIFDLASLTKPLATALAVMKLVQTGAVSLEHTAASILPEFKSPAKEKITLGRLLTHTSGLPAYVPYYEQIADRPRKSRKSELQSLLAQTPLEYPVGESCVYSDVGYMVLNWMVERLSGLPLNVFVGRYIYAPLGLNQENGLFFVELDAEIRKGVFAATEKCLWRKKVVCGEVHDENAYASGGVEGHAGLFGGIEAVHHLLFALMSSYHGRQNIFPPALVKHFLTPKPGEHRTPGFDRPEIDHSSAGAYFSNNSVGHLGFTGTSFWMDLERHIIVILLTNRIHPSRENERIKDFRPRLHDAVMMQLIGADDIKAERKA